MNKLKLSLAITLLIGNTVTWAEDLFTCPENLSVSSKVLTEYEGWQTINQDSEVKLPLQAISFFDGPPEEKAMLKPQGYRKIAEGEGTIEHEFFNDHKGWKGNWIVCSYSRTVQTLSKKLPKPYSRCIISYTKDTRYATCQ